MLLEDSTWCYSERLGTIVDAPLFGYVGLSLIRGEDAHSAGWSGESVLGDGSQYHLLILLRHDTLSS